MSELRETLEQILSRFKNDNVRYDPNLDYDEVEDMILDAVIASLPETPKDWHNLPSEYGNFEGYYRGIEECKAILEAAKEQKS